LIQVMRLIEKGATKRLAASAARAISLRYA
jgi:hypothetical protein